MNKENWGSERILCIDKLSCRAATVECSPPQERAGKLLLRCASDGPGKIRECSRTFPDMPFR